MQPPDIDTVNNTILLCVFCLGMITGGVISMIVGGK
jgi:hypothetical protein